MKSFKTIFALALVGSVIFAASGCSADKSGDTQQMPKSASAPNESPKPPANIPPQAQDAISKAAPVSSGN